MKKTIYSIFILVSILIIFISYWRFIYTPMLFIGEANAISSVEVNNVISFYQKYGYCPSSKVKNLPSVKFIKSMWYDKAKSGKTCLIVSDSQEITTHQKGKLFIFSVTFDNNRKLTHKNCSTNISKILPYIYEYCTNPIIYKKYFDSEGNQKATAYYKRGTLLSPIISFYGTGVKRTESYQYNVQLDGPLTAWYHNGIKKLSGTFSEGKQIGIFTYWDKDGNKTEEIYWKSPGELSKKLEFDKQGNIIKETKFEDKSAQYKE